MHFVPSYAIGNLDPISDADGILGIKENPDFLRYDFIPGKVDKETNMSSACNSLWCNR